MKDEKSNTDQLTVYLIWTTTLAKRKHIVLRVHITGDISLPKRMAFRLQDLIAIYLCTAQFRLRVQRRLTLTWLASELCFAMLTTQLHYRCIMYKVMRTQTLNRSNQLMHCEDVFDN